MSIKLITCSSEFCSAHGNKTICFKVFSEESRTWQSDLLDQKRHTGGRKKKKKDKPTNRAFPTKTERKRNLSSKQKKSDVLILSQQQWQLNSWRTHHQPHRCSPDWFISRSARNDLFGSLICSLICYQFQLAVLKPLCTMAQKCLDSFAAITHVRTPDYTVVEMPHTYNQSVAFTSLI